MGPAKSSRHFVGAPSILQVPVELVPSKLTRSGVSLKHSSGVPNEKWHTERLGVHGMRHRVIRTTADILLKSAA